jgi:hypothetical protein
MGIRPTDAEARASRPEVEFAWASIYNIHKLARKLSPLFAQWWQNRALIGCDIGMKRPVLQRA